MLSGYYSRFEQGRPFAGIPCRAVRAEVVFVNVHGILEVAIA